MSKQFEGFESPNTTPVPDIVFDELLSELTGNELKVLLYIIRRTYGFDKSADAISLSQFREGIITQDKKVLDKGCGIHHNRTILVALAALEKRGCVIATKRHTNAGDSDTTIYKLRFKQAAEAQSDKKVVTWGNDLVTPSNDGSYPTSLRSLPQVTTVVTSGNPQETVLQQTDSQETVRQESTSSPSLDVDAHAPESSLEKTTETLIDVQANLARLKAQFPSEERTHDDAVVDPPLPARATHGGSTPLQVHGRLPDRARGTDPSEKGDDDGHLTHIAPVLQHGGAATANPPGGSRAPEGKKTSKGKGVTQGLPPEVVRILDDWDSLHKKPFPRTEKHVQAAFLLITDNPTKEDLHECEKWHYTTDRPEKPWYRIHGVRLQDIAENIGRWRALQDAPALPAKRGRESPEDFTSKTLDKERNDRRIQEMIEQSKKIRAEREAAQAAK